MTKHTKRDGFQIGNIECDPPVVLAPMAAITNPPFRLICREMGAGMVVTEMFIAHSLASKKSRSRKTLDIREDEHPVSVQILGKDIPVMVRAAQTAEESGADMVDINMGCPMKKVVHSGNGAALLKSPSKIYDLVSAMVKNTNIPITAKIRAGFEDSNGVEIAKAIEDAGGKAIAIHARTRCEMFEGHPDLNIIREIKENISIPVIGNGDVYDAESAQTMMEETGCDGVMIARGGMGNPWIFREVAHSFLGKELPEEPTVQERSDVIRKHVHLYADTYGEGTTCLEIRKHLLWYFKGTPGEPHIKKNLAGLQTLSGVYQVIEDALSICLDSIENFQFPRGLRKHPNRRQS